MKNFNFLICILIIIIGQNTVKLDIPVHCLSSQIYGTWNFQISKEKFKPSLDNEKTTCGHGFPNRVINLKINNEIKDHELIILKLDSEMKIKDEKDNEIGNYTLVYDEGMILYFKDSTITVHFYYYPDSEHRGLQSSTGPNSNSEPSFKSDCSKTHKGWFIPDIKDKEKNWSCVYGFKSEDNRVSSGDDNKLKVLDNNENSNSFLKTTNFAQVTSTTKSKTNLELNTSNYSKKYESMNELVEIINEDPDSTWKAKINSNFNGLSFIELHERMYSNKKANNANNNYKAEKINELFQHLSYLKSTTNKKKSSTKSLNFIQTQSMIRKNKIGKSNINSNNTKKHESKEREKDSKEVTDYKEITKYIKTDINDINVNILPKNWDWRDVGGRNFIPPVRQQGDCGSCYSISSLNALTSRLWIKTNLKDQTILSPQHVLNCGIYTEGCDGGYPILIGKFHSEFDLATEDCSPYTGKTDKCESKCSSGKYRVGNYGYLGGFYMNSTEEQMIKELRARGPILGNISVPMVFGYYSSGIFSEKKNISKNSNVEPSSESMYEKGLEFLKVEHSTLIVGYGEEDGTKYWICQNSWGKDWGDKGFYKVIRGANEINIESMGDFLDIHILDKKQ